MPKTHLPPQVIAARALDEPAIGYDASPKFTLSIIKCPKCGGFVYYRHRVLHTTPLGATCTKCPWISAYPMKPEEAESHTQTDLPNLPPHQKAPSKRDRL